MRIILVFDEQTSMAGLPVGLVATSSARSPWAAWSADAPWASRLSIRRSAGVSRSQVLRANHSSRAARAGVGALGESDAAQDATSVGVPCSVTRAGASIEISALFWVVSSAMNSSRRTWLFEGRRSLVQGRVLQQTNANSTNWWCQG